MIAGNACLRPLAWIRVQLSRAAIRRGRDLRARVTRGRQPFAQAKQSRLWQGRGQGAGAVGSQAPPSFGPGLDPENLPRLIQPPRPRPLSLQ